MENNMENISLFLNSITENMTSDQKQKSFDYFNQLSPIQLKALCIAKEHLGSSFHLLKSNGFIKFIQLKT